MNILRATYRFLTSIRLTLFLLTLSVVLIFFGTLDQVHYGIYFTQKKYFESLVAVWSYPQQWGWSEYLGWLQLPIPGGYIIGPLLVLNLTAAHFRYYRARWRKLGIILIHAGLILLLLGQLWTQLRQREYFMWLSEGESGNFVESFHYDELVVIDKSNPAGDRVISWPVKAFKDGATTLRHPDLPFELNVMAYFENAAIFPRSNAPEGRFGPMPFNRGTAAERDFIVVNAPPTFAQNERNARSVVVSLRTPTETIGTWLLSNVFRDRFPTTVPFPPQEFVHDGRTYEIALRFERRYLNDTIQLLDFTHERYPGTDIPFNFSSEVRIINPQSASQRSTLIYMNHPLRHEGLTFYQASFADNDTRSMFQVVRNPARWVPYIASAVITLGLTLQFLISLFERMLRRNPSLPAQS